MIKNYSTCSSEDICLVSEEDLKAHFYVAIPHFISFRDFCEAEDQWPAPTAVIDRVPRNLEIPGEVSMGFKQKY